MRMRRNGVVVAITLGIIALGFYGCDKTMRSAEDSSARNSRMIKSSSKDAVLKSDAAKSAARVVVSKPPASFALWCFAVPTAPGKDSSGNDNNLKVNGDPIVKKGEIILHGGSVRLPKIKQDFLYSASKKLKLGTGSFSVECWFKSSKITYMKLIGTRDTIRLCYKDRIGWALGLSKGDSSIIFVLNGKNGAQSAAKVKIVDSSWETDAWNQLVGVRNTKAKTVELYINGKLAATAPDDAGDVAVSRDLTVGLDAYAGCLTEGSIREIRISKSVVSPKTVAAEYAKALCSQVDVKKVKLKDIALSIPRNLKIDPTDGLNGKLDLQPTPVRFKYSSEFVKLPTPVFIKVPENAKPTTLAAKRIITEDLESMLGLKVQSAEIAPGSGGTLIVLEETVKNIKPESYALTVNGKSKSAVVRITSADNGMMYGAMTLSQIIGQSSLIMKGKASIPKTVEISDYPAIPHRIHVRILAEGGKCSDASIENAMRSIARKRMNFYSVHLMEYSENNMRRMVKIAGEHGIKILATVSYRGFSRALGRPASPADFKAVERKFEMAARVGVRGFSLHFDDLERYARIAAADPRGVGAFQRQFINALRKIALKHNINFISVCPTMYMRHWRRSAKTWFGDPRKYADYFEKISQFKDGDIEVFHCDLSADSVADLKKLGVAKPAFYLNGVWTTNRWFSYYVGPPRLSWSWYGFKIDPIRGPVTDEEMMKQWKLFEKIGVKSVWVGAGGFRGPFIAGIWMWNPAAFNEDAALREANRVAGLGAGTFKVLMDYERNMLPLVSLFMTYVNGATSECHPVELKREHPLNQNDLLRYWRNYKSAELAAAEVKSIVAKRSSNLEKPWLPHGTHSTPMKITLQMEKSLKAFRGKLLRKMKRFNIGI